MSKELSYCLAYKALELMTFSNVGYGKHDYLRTVNWLYDDGMIEEGEKLKNKLMAEVPRVFDLTIMRTALIKKILQDCKTLGTDYIGYSPHGGTCSECAKSQGRVYSISGRDYRFPKLPQIVVKIGGFHDGCRCSFHPYCIYLVVKPIGSIIETINPHQRKR